MDRLLSQDRSSLPDVPAVYFVEPTSENVKKICEVCIKGVASGEVLTSGITGYEPWIV